MWRNLKYRRSYDAYDGDDDMEASTATATHSYTCEQYTLGKLFAYVKYFWVWC